MREGAGARVRGNGGRDGERNLGLELVVQGAVLVPAVLAHVVLRDAVLRRAGVPAEVALPHGEGGRRDEALQPPAVLGSNLRRDSGGVVGIGGWLGVAVGKATLLLVGASQTRIVFRAANT